MSVLNSPASRGIIGVLLIYLLGLEKILGDFLWIPAKIVIFLAIIVVGSRLGLITNTKKTVFEFEKNIQYSLILKLLFLPLIVFIICKVFDLEKIETIALVLQAATPSAISTILLAEAYQIKRDLAAKILFITTILSIGTIPIIALFID